MGTEKQSHNLRLLRENYHQNFLDLIHEDLGKVHVQFKEKTLWLNMILAKLEVGL